jgi:aldose 1-epimerase
MAEPITLQHGPLRARIDHERGASLIDLHARAPRVAHATDADVWLPIVSRGVAGEDARANPACFFMAPWCNRVRDAVFTWNGRRVALKADPRDGTAMHGDVRKRPWTILDRSPVSARLGFDSTSFAGSGAPVNFPWRFACTARYELRDASLLIAFDLTNTDTEPFPCGVGLHPYFPRVQRPGAEHASALSPGGRQMKLVAPVQARFPSERCMPTGPGARDAMARRLCAVQAPAPGYQMDSYHGYQGTCVIDWPASRLSMTSSPNHEQLVYFAPTTQGVEDPFVAIEPMTICADGFNMLAQGRPHHGVRVLAPGETLRSWHELAVEFR